MIKLRGKFKRPIINIKVLISIFINRTFLKLKFFENLWSNFHIFLKYFCSEFKKASLVLLFKKCTSMGYRWTIWQIFFFEYEIYFNLSIICIIFFLFLLRIKPYVNSQSIYFFFFLALGIKIFFYTCELLKFWMLNNLFAF